MRRGRSKLLRVRDGATGTELASAMRTAGLQAQRQRNGQQAEELVRKALVARGLRLVEKVEVGFGVTADGRRFAKGKVSGDFRAVCPVALDGRPAGLSVLIEVKAHDERLGWAAFRPHQIDALDEHDAAGGITEVAWVDRGHIRFIPWFHFRLVGFRPGRSVVWTGETIAIHAPARGKRET